MPLSLTPATSVQSSSDDSLVDDWARPFELLRGKWHKVPAGHERFSTQQLLDLPNAELLEYWSALRRDATTGEAFDVRGWYHELYTDVLHGKRVMDVGSGLGIDGITLVQHGACITFVDIVETNLAVLKRLCRQLDLTNVRFCYLDDLDALSTLADDYDAIWCQGSLIHAPFHVIRNECQELLKHLPIGGRWIELAYPRTRWERDGQLPFNEWGACTDGEDTPWVEWYDLDKLRAALAPAKFDVVLHFEFHNSDFNWFDLVRTA